MQIHEGTAELASTDFSEDKTGLATILQLFKDRIHLDVTAIELVELTNGNIDTQNIPLFVLKHKKQDKRNSCQKGMRGKSPISFVRSSKTIRLKAFRSFSTCILVKRLKTVMTVFLLKTFCK